jgi:hypothetical protein
MGFHGLTAVAIQSRAFGAQSPALSVRSQLTLKFSSSLTTLK